MSTRERLQRIEAKVRQMEQALGLDNPQVSQAAPNMLFHVPLFILPAAMNALPVK